MSCTVAGLTNGATYGFDVVAVNAAGTSAAAPSNTVTPGSPLLPLGPGTGGGTTVVPPGGLPAAGSLLLVNGVKTPVTVVPDHKTVSKARGLQISGPGFEMRLVGRGDTADPLGLTPKQALVLESEPVATRGGVLARSLPAAKAKATAKAKAKAKATVQPVAESSGTGFKPNSSVQFYLLADTYLGALQADATGAYSGSVPVPAGIVPGAYTLQVNGFTESGEVRSLSLGVIVTRTAASVATRKAHAEVFFAPLSSALTPQAKATLQKLVKTTGKQGVRTVVVGLVQPVGGVANDHALSTARANAVAKQLKSLGLRGAYSVKGDGRASESGAQARRVDVTVTFRK